MRGKLVQMTSNHKQVRTKEIVGDFFEVPVEGRTFIIYSEPLTKGTSIRILSTSLISKVINLGDSYFFTTQNSEYVLIAEREPATSWFTRAAKRILRLIGLFNG